MRIIFIQAFLFVSFISNAQSGLYEQIKRIVANSGNGFIQLRANEKLDDSKRDSIFFSAIQIEETTNNEIHKLDTLTWVYNAVIADSVKMRKAEKISDEWKEKIEEILAGGFLVKKYKVVDYNPSKYGWRFSNDRLIISIDVMSLRDGKFNWVWLAFMNY